MKNQIIHSSWGVAILGIILGFAFLVIPRQFDPDQFRNSVVLLENGNGRGTGVFITPDTFVTNYHVSGGAPTITFRVVSDQFNYTADRVADNVRFDLAVYKIQPESSRLLQERDRLIVPLEWADSFDVEIGDRVWNIGSAFGFEFIVTRGIISAPFIFDETGAFTITDALLFPGNSGGPMIDTEGRIVGINTKTLSVQLGLAGATSNHFNAAIPANIAERILNDLLQGETGTLNTIGIMIDINHSNHYLTAVTDNDEQIVLENDQLLGFMREEDRRWRYFTNSGSYIVLEQSSQNGDKIKLLIERDGEQIEIEVTVEAFDFTPQN